MEWIPFDCINIRRYRAYMHVHGPPTSWPIRLIPLEITDGIHDLYYAEVNYLRMRHVY